MVVKEGEKGDVEGILKWQSAAYVEEDAEQLRFFGGSQGMNFTRQHRCSKLTNRILAPGF